MAGQKGVSAPTIIIDFDSTFTKAESPVELAAISLKGNPKREAITKKVDEITNAAMEGKISIATALEKRIRLMKANRRHLIALVRVLKKKVSPSFVRNKEFLKENADKIFIVSNGYREFIAPVVKPFGIAEKNIIANTFKFDKAGNIVGLDTTNPLARDKGKVRAVEKLGLRGEVYVIGDGITDYEIKKYGAATKFFAFTENVARESVMEHADHVISSFDEFLHLNALPGAVSYPKSKLKVLLLENIHPDAIAHFRTEGYQIEAVSKSLSEEELREKIRDVSVLGIRSKTEVTKRVLAEAKRLMAIGAFCIGTNQIDLEECSKRGIAVFNAPYSNTRSVVELVIGEIIMLMRDVFDKSAKLHRGVWNKSAKGSFEVRGKKLGIIGYGNIGTQLSVAAEALGMEVYFYDIVEKLSIGNAVKCLSMEEVLKKSDVVSIHVDGSPRNKNLVGEREFKLMKEGSYLINLSRGSVVDTKALAEVLRSGKLLGAALDVFPHEPKGNDEPFKSELQNLPNVILTPHIGGSTEEAQENMPGVLANINGALAKHKINILGQYLKTNERTGYVITDVSKKYDKAVIDAMRNVPHTVKFRVLY